MNNKIIPFPKLKQTDKKVEEREDLAMYDDVSDITQHYITQMIGSVKNNGFKITPDLLQDFVVLQEVLRSALLRNVHLHHPFQDYVDAMREMSHNQKEKENDSN